ncbi:hypothetical protein JD969_14935 [Planctomycetota bacterium]|nr:hypothetical protein JD969_14935 [Planctomycetota bacterium]
MPLYTVYYKNPKTNQNTSSVFTAGYPEVAKLMAEDLGYEVLDIVSLGNDDDSQTAFAQAITKQGGSRFATWIANILIILAPIGFVFVYFAGIPQSKISFHSDAASIHFFFNELAFWLLVAAAGCLLKLLVYIIAHLEARTMTSQPTQNH